MGETKRRAVLYDTWPYAGLVDYYEFYDEDDPETVLATENVEEPVQDATVARMKEQGPALVAYNPDGSRRWAYLP